MTAHQLARLLLDGPDLPVHLTYNYGDQWQTTVAPEVENAEQASVQYSTYHDMPKIVDDPEEGDKETTRIIALS